MNSKLEILSLALERNDKAIQFADAKAGFLAAYISLLVGLVFEHLGELTQLAASHENRWLAAVAAIGLLLFATGILMTLVASLATVRPRLPRREGASFLFFGAASGLGSEKALVERSDSTAERLDAVAEQVLSTAGIAQSKYSFLKWGSFATALATMSCFALLVISLVEWIPEKGDPLPPPNEESGQVMTARRLTRDAEMAMLPKGDLHLDSSLESAGPTERSYVFFAPSTDHNPHSLPLPGNPDQRLPDGVG